MRHLLHVRPVDSWRIYDPVGVWIGNIDTLLLDAPSGLVRFAWAEFFEITRERLALPWRALTFSRERGAFMTFATEQQLATSPQISVFSAADEIEETLNHHYKLEAPSKESRAGLKSPRVKGDRRG